MVRYHQTYPKPTNATFQRSCTHMNRKHTRTHKIYINQFWLARLSNDLKQWSDNKLREQQWSLKSWPISGSGFETQEFQTAMVNGRAPENQTVTRLDRKRRQRSASRPWHTAGSRGDLLFSWLSLTGCFYHLLSVYCDFPRKGPSSKSSRGFLLMSYGERMKISSAASLTWAAISQAKLISHLYKQWLERRLTEIRGWTTSAV